MIETEDTNFGRKLVTFLQEPVVIVRGEMDEARVHLGPADIELRAIREQLDLSRPAFA